MARLNEILVGRFARGLQKVFGIKGPVPVATLAPEIMPVVVIPVGVENRYLEGWFRFGQNPATTAVAAQFGGIRLRNPAGGNIIVVIEKLTISSAGVTDSPIVELSPGITTDLTTLLTPQRIDGRGQPRPTAILSITSNSATLGANTNILQANIGTTGVVDLILIEDHQLVLSPGDAIQIRSIVANTALGMSIIWRERFLEESERT